MMRKMLSILVVTVAVAGLLAAQTKKPKPKETPAALLWTGYYYMDAWILAQTARILGQADDAATYGRLAEAIRDALIAKWFDIFTTTSGVLSQIQGNSPYAAPDVQ